ncbi:MAG: DUF1861 family protein [Lachnospiraceae bacterium]
MDIRQARAAFDKEGKIYDSALLTFVGVDGYDVYNCSIPFAMNGREYIFGRVETRREWATSWVRLFEKTGKDTYTLVPDSMIYQLEDPYIQLIGDQLTMGGTHVMKESGKVKSFYGYFYRGAELEHMRYFTTGPDKMKDIRLVSLKDGAHRRFLPSPGQKGGGDLWLRRGDRLCRHRFAGRPDRRFD